MHCLMSSDFVDANDISKALASYNMIELNNCIIEIYEDIDGMNLKFFYLDDDSENEICMESHDFDDIAARINSEIEYHNLTIDEKQYCYLDNVDKYRLYFMTKYYLKNKDSKINEYIKELLKRIYEYHDLYEKCNFSYNDWMAVNSYVNEVLEKNWKLREEFEHNRAFYDYDEMKLMK